MSRISKPIQTKCSLVVYQGWYVGVQEVRKKWRLSANGYEVSQEVMKNKCSKVMLIVAELCEYAKNY